MNITINIPQFFNIDGKSGRNFNYLYPLNNGDTTDSRLFILCDGSSGGVKGDASSLVTKGFYEYFTQKRPPKDNAVGQLYMNDALRFVEGKLREYVQSNPKERGMRSTLALLYFNENDTLTIAWVGNSRIYHVRGNQIITKTQDHTVNAYKNGKTVVVPRAISGIEPAYLSLSIVKDILPGDYFLMCSEGVVETLDDRNIRYLLSQGDGNINKNKAIVEKIKDLCSTHSYKGCGLYLLQIDSTAEGSIENMPITTVANTANSSDVSIDTGPIRRKSSGFKTPSISKASRNAFLLSLLILTVVAIAFAYKLQQSKPEVVFEQQMIQAEELITKGAYQDAIALYQSSLNLALEDTSVFAGVRAKIRQAEEQQMIGIADKLYKDGMLLKARDEYKNVLTFHPNSEYASKKLQSIEDYLLKEKNRLIVEADSLMQVNGFEQARNSLFEALYLAQQDTQLLYRINNTYKALKEDTLDMALAIGKAIQIGTAPPATAEEEEDDLYTDVEEETLVEEYKNEPKIRERRPVKVEVLKPDTDDSIITHQEYKNLLEEGKTAYDKGNLELAATKYKAALEYNSTEGVVNKLKEINEKLSSKSKYNDLMQQADAAFQSKKYEEAQRLYQEALKVEKDDGYAAQRIEIAKNMIEQSQANNAFQKLITDADKAFDSNNFATARELYQRALSDASDPAAINAKIAKCNEKIIEMQADISKKRLRKGEKLCESTNYNSECYYHLRDNNLLYSVNPQVLYKLGQHFEGKDTNRAKECYNIAAGKGSAPAAEKLKELK
ncbi:MAG: tetratricopeptide repeat protein [Chitinophagales bacterium]